ncbi:MAG: hypothetical protein NT135_01325 [Candidatus Berkelbacteria bacterium]|nr:hypothetical protein [Candidatus Berkelbacteria bacterium]
MILAIEISDNIKLTLYKKGVKREFTAKREKEKDAFHYLVQFLKKNKVKLKDLKAIAVNQSSVSFTGLRVGISIANALAYVLNIPVVGFKNPSKMAEKTFEKLNAKKYKLGEYIKPTYK